MKKLIIFLFIFITGLHNKPQGCGASVASAAGPFFPPPQKKKLHHQKPAINVLNYGMTSKLRTKNKISQTMKTDAYGTKKLLKVRVAASSTEMRQFMRNSKCELNRLKDRY
jgi:RNA-binding protein YhbY